MALRINFNSTAVRAHASLRDMDRLLSRSMERMASGLRLQSSADDPGGLVQANALRYHLSGLERASTNAEDAVNMLQTAEGAMDQINARLLRMRELAIGAANEGVNDPQQLQAYQDELDAAVGSITRLAANTQYGSQKLLDGSLADDTLSDAARLVYSTLRQDDTQLPDGVLEGSTLDIGVPSGPLAKDLIGVTLRTGAAAIPGRDDVLQNLVQNGQALSSTAGQTMTITGPHGSSTIALSATTTITQFVSLANAVSEDTGARAVYDETTGNLYLESLHYGASGLNVQATDMSGGANIGLLDSDTTGIANPLVVAATNPTVTVDYLAEDGSNRTAILTLDPLSEGGLTFTDGVFSLTTKDTSDGSIGWTITPNAVPVTATRASTLHFQVGALAGQRVRVELPDMRAGALGHSADDPVWTDLQSLVDGQVFENGGAQNAIAVIDAAISEVGSARGRLGATQANTLEAGMEALRVAIENVTSSESRIRDTDFALESAEFARTNILLQAATSMLAQANQVPQSVLQLLQ